MASNLLTHLPLASTQRASIAFFLLIITIFVVPFFSLTTSSDLIPSVNTLPTIAYTLWVSLLDILTSSPFYFLLLNFLIVALVFLSGVLDPSSAGGREFDGLQEEDLHQRGLHSYPTAAQMIHERLAFDELYESQASSLSYLNIIESSLTYVAGDGAIDNGYGDDDEARIGKGKQIMANPIDLFLQEKPAFSNAGDSDSAEEGSSSSKVDATKECLPTGGMVRDDLDIEENFPVSSVVLKSEIAHPHGVCKDIQAEIVLVCESKDLHPESDAHANADVDARTPEHTADAIKTDNDVMDDEDSNDVIHDQGGGDHIDDKNVHIDHECNCIEAKAEGAETQRQRIARTPSEVEGAGKKQPPIARMRSEPVRRRHRIARTPSEPTIAGNIHPQQRESEVGADMGRCMSLERVEWLSVEKQKAGEEMSTEELNERASAFISAFRKKLVSTAIDDTSGQM